MQLSIHQTDYQKDFLSLVKNQSLDYYKSKILSCNVSGDIDHSLTNTLFNLINKEISSLLESIPALTDAYTSVQLESKNLKKTILSDHSSDRIMSLTESFNMVDHYLFSSTLKKQSTPYKFLYEKFSASIQKLIVTMGVYEELYLINTLAISYDSSFSLSFDKSAFSFSTRSNSLSFKVIPIFFLVKFLLSKTDSIIAIQLILEQLLSYDFQQVQYLVTISDMDQISPFYDFCSMQNLSDFMIAKLAKNDQFQLPRVINPSQLHI